MDFLDSFRFFFELQGSVLYPRRVGFNSSMTLTFIVDLARGRWGRERAREESNVQMPAWHQGGSLLLTEESVPVSAGMCMSPTRMRSHTQPARVHGLRQKPISSAKRIIPPRTPLQHSCTVHTTVATISALWGTQQHTQAYTAVSSCCMTFNPRCANPCMPHDEFKSAKTLPCYQQGLLLPFTKLAAGGMIKQLLVS